MTAPLSIRSQIGAALLAKVDSISEYEYTAFDVVRLTASDFQEHELPACQIIDLGNPNTHERNRGKRQWNIAIEVILGPKTAGAGYEPTQQDLWDLMEYTENQIFAQPNLGIAGVVHMQLLDSYTDLHMMAPFYVGRIEILVEYYQPLVSPC